MTIVSSMDLHQFSKVELFAMTSGGLEESSSMLDEIRELEEHRLGHCNSNMNRWVVNYRAVGDTCTEESATA